MSLARFWSSLKLLRFSQPAGDRPLYQAVRGRTIGSVLEVHIAQAVRAERLVGWLREQGTTGTIRYAAIDPFETGGAGHIGLKDFHSRLGRLGTKPLPVPIAGSLAASLTRVAHTIGAVDLLILDGSEADYRGPAVEAILPRLVHAETIVMAMDDQSRRLQLCPASRYAEPTARRAAA